MARSSSLSSVDSSSSDSFKSFPSTPPRSPLREQLRMASVQEKLILLDAAQGNTTTATETTTNDTTQTVAGNSSNARTVTENTNINPFDRADDTNPASFNNSEIPRVIINDTSTNETGDYFDTSNIGIAITSDTNIAHDYHSNNSPPRKINVADNTNASTARQAHIAADVPTASSSSSSSSSSNNTPPRIFNVANNTNTARQANIAPDTFITNQNKNNNMASKTDVAQTINTNTPKYTKGANNTGTPQILYVQTKPVETSPDFSSISTDSPRTGVSSSSSSSMDHRPMTAEEVAAEAGMTIPLRIPPKSVKRYAKKYATLRPPIPAPPPYVLRDSSGVPLPIDKITGANKEEMAAVAAKEGYGQGKGDRQKLQFLSLLGLSYGEWGSDKKRKCKFGTLVALGLIAIIALAVGLGVGLTVGRKSHHDDNNDNSSSSSSSSPSSSTPAYPAGSFTFNSTLRKQQTDCTTNSNVWQCYPYDIGQPAPFFWNINHDPANQGGYTISSTNNPFAPSFTNLTLALKAASTSDEHYVFNFNMNKTDASTVNNKNAQCTFDNTKFEATIWTRRHNGKSISTPQTGGVKFSDWPGDVQVVQMSSEESGEPKCVDMSGNNAGSIPTGTGDCLCQYASFDST